MPQAVIEEQIVIEDKRLGRHINHDPKSRLYKFQSDRPVTAELVAVEHEIALPFIIDQGDLGRCVPCTGTAYVAFRQIWNTLDASVKNEILNNNDAFTKQLYRDVTRADPFQGAWEPDDTGSDGLTLAKVLTSRGYIAGYTHTFNPAEALIALQDYPLAIGIEWLSGCDSPNSSGLVSYSGTVRGGHEILVVGYDPVKQWVKIRNSWGKYWGLNGHFFMTVADFTRAINNWGDVIILTPVTEPAPVPNYDDADLALVTGMEPWSKGIISKLTKAGRANAAYKQWKIEKGLTGL